MAGFEGLGAGTGGRRVELDRDEHSGVTSGTRRATRTRPAAAGTGPGRRAPCRGTSACHNSVWTAGDGIRDLDHAHVLARCPQAVIEATACWQQVMSATRSITRRRPTPAGGGDGRADPATHAMSHTPSRSDRTLLALGASAASRRRKAPSPPSAPRAASAPPPKRLPHFHLSCMSSPSPPTPRPAPTMSRPGLVSGGPSGAGLGTAGGGCGGGMDGGAWGCGALRIIMWLRPSIIARSTPPTAADLDAARQPPRAART
mmetsp:Transcript_20939/g.70313  ORF Transcript_20939/g.70313 Transcript_20939/m.70313 type:complete len:259 (-) Transcript_20939:346-1122(-)